MYRGHNPSPKSIYDYCPDVAQSPRVVVDMGAHQGAGYRQLRSMYPDATIHLVEPVRDCIDALRAASSQDENVVIHPYAVGREDSITVINTFESDGRQSSNLYSDRGGVYGSPVKEVIRVASYRQLPTHIDLAKINIEAGEFDLLETDFFDRIDSFVMEAHNNLIPGKTWQDVVKSLEGKFDLLTAGNLNYKYCFVMGVKIPSLSR